MKRLKNVNQKHDCDLQSEDAEGKEPITCSFCSVPYDYHATINCCFLLFSAILSMNHFCATISIYHFSLGTMFDVSALVFFALSSSSSSPPFSNSSLAGGLCI